MKPIPAIVERDHDTVLATVRDRHSALRSAEAQISKTEKRLDDMRSAAELRRKELGKALTAAHELWPDAKAAQGGARGPGGRTWEQFLESEGISKTTAWRYMEMAAGRPVSFQSTDEVKRPVDNHPGEIIGDAPSGPRLVPDAPDFDPVPQPPAPLPRPGFTLRLGDWKLALRDVGVVDTLICDPPYGARTHASETTRADGSDVDGLAPDYEAWTPDDVARFVAHWSTRVRGWMVALTSHDLIPAWEAAYLAADRYSFAPVPCVIRGMSVRVRADGPSSWAIYAMVARPRNAEFVNWRTLPGAYVGPSQPGAESGRGKPLWLMKELVGDYSRENDLVCDPLAGYGSTLLAALETGRRAVGAERDHGAYDEAYRRAATPREEPTNP